MLAPCFGLKYRTHRSHFVDRFSDLHVYGVRNVFSLIHKDLSLVSLMLFFGYVKDFPQNGDMPFSFYL